MADVKIRFIDPQGQEQETSPTQVIAQLREAGYNPTGVDATGMTVHFEDPRGNYSLPVRELFSQFGSQVMQGGVEPVNPDESAINFGWRAAISKLPDDDSKKAYLEAKLRREGIQNPVVEGSGRNWYAFNPSAGWQSLTNSKSWDMSDVVEGVTEVPRMAGSTAGLLGGAALGAPGGPVGVVAGGAAGAGAGSAAAEGLLRSALAATDPDFASAASFGQQARDVSLNAGIDMALGGLSGGVGQLLGKGAQAGAPLMTRGAQNVQFISPISSTLKGAGAITRGVGAGVETAGKLADTPIGREVVKYSIPGVQQAALAADIAQLPKAATTMIPKGTQAAAEMGKKAGILTEEGAARLAQKGADLTTPHGPIMLNKDTALGKFGEAYRTTAEGAEEAIAKTARKVMGKPEPIGDRASDVLSNIAGDLRQKAFMPTREAVTESLKKTLKPGQELSEGMIDDALREATDQATAQAQRLGQKAGRALDVVADTGKAIDKGLNVAVGGVAKTAKATGKALQETGRGAKILGTAAQPIEQFGYNKAVQEFISPEARSQMMFDAAQERRNKMKRGELTSDFADLPVDYSQYP